MKTKISNTLLVVALIIMSFLTSCGDDGTLTRTPPLPPPGPGISDGNHAPTAVIETSTLEVIPGDVVFLSGSRSSDPDHDAISYKWTQTAGPIVEFCCETGAINSFTVPNASAIITISLVVTDHLDKPSTPVTVDIRVNPAPESEGPMTAVFVSAQMGSDSRSRSGSAREPVKTIRRAISVAQQKHLTNIYVTEGTYIEEVNLPSNIIIRGGAVIVNGLAEFPTEIQGNEKSIIKASSTSGQAIVAQNVEKSIISRFKIIGGNSRAVRIENSKQITISESSLSTPGSVGATCHDVEMSGGDAIVVSKNLFKNSKTCSDYVSISVENSKDTDIDENGFEFSGGGNERYIKAVQSVGGESTIVSQNDVHTGVNETLSNQTILSAFTIGDTLNPVISSNQITIEGASDSIGVSLRCTNNPINSTVEKNVIKLNAHTRNGTGVRMTCDQASGSLLVDSNKIFLSSANAASAGLRGVDISAVGWPISFKAINNIISMPALTTDNSTKSGIYLSMLDAGSSVEIYFNTLLLDGGASALNAVYSDAPNVSISFKNNIAFVGGTGATNAVFYLPDACATNCASNVSDNLINLDRYFIHYYDTQRSVPSSSVAADNNVAQLMASYFDFVQGLVTTNYQSYVNGNALVIGGVSTDINSTPRGNPPDIGATEY